MSRSRRRKRRPEARPAGDRAIIYVRVSTNAQVDGNSLESQERMCRDYCQREGLTVVRVFREEGESAKSANRTQLQTLLRYCSGSGEGHDISWLIVYDVSRFSREFADHYVLRQTLASDGVLLRSVTQQFDESPTGEYIEGLSALNAQHENRLRAAAARRNMEQAVRNGEWMWQAPLGYRRGRKGAEPSLVPDYDVAPLIRRAFEEMATGLRTKRQVLDDMTTLGLLSRSGKAMTAQRFGDMLTNPIYAGRISCAFQDDGPGDFEAIVDLDLFDAVQAVLDGRKPTTTARRRDNPDFPLRRIIRCSGCDKPLTASWSKNRTGQPYGYYFCYRKGCGEVKVPKHVLETQFTDLLDRLSIRPEMFQLLAAVVEETWRDAQADATTARRRLTVSIEKVEQRRDRLMDSYLDGGIDQTTFDSTRRRLDQQWDELRHDLDRHKLAEVDLDATLAFAESMLVDLPGCWNRLEPQQRPDFVRALCPDDLTYQDGTIGTAHNPWWIKGFAASDGPTDDWVPPTGFEPVLSP